MKTLYCYSTNKLGPLKPRDLSWLWGKKKPQSGSMNTPSLNIRHITQNFWGDNGISTKIHACRAVQDSRSLQLGSSRLMYLQLVKLHLWYQFCIHKEPSTAEAVIPYLWTRTSLLLETWLGLLNRHIMGLIGVGVEWGAWVGTHARLEEKETGIIYLLSVEVLLLMRWIGKLLLEERCSHCHLLKPPATLPELY